MIDKLLRAAADSLDVEFLVLGVRYEEAYELIATHGVPVANFAERVPADRLPPKLFARPVEIEDLQANPNWFNLGMLPVAQFWRYGANAPIKLYHPVTDDGVIALSVADRRLRPLGGKMLTQLKQYAEFLSDCIWLVMQIHVASAVSNLEEIAATMLLDGVRNAPPAVALVDEALVLLGHSRRFGEVHTRHFGEPPRLGVPLTTNWLSAAAAEAVRKSMKTARPVIKRETGVLPDGTTLDFDFHTIRYDSIGQRFGLFGLHVPLSRSDLCPVPSAKRVGAVATESGEAGPVTSFLLETLGHRPRILARGTQSYVAVRSWRNPIKKYQLSALKSLKRDCPKPFVEHVAAELAGAVRKIHGNVDHCIVVPMPCGHSGETCLSGWLGSHVARALGVPSINAFAPIKTRGSSHPKTNVRRPKMELVSAPTQTVILIDDVAASGAHIAEASTLLMRTAAAVLPIVWVAD